MKNLTLAALALFMSTNILAFECKGSGYVLNVEGDSISIEGNGISVRGKVTDDGSAYRASFGRSNIKSITLTPYYSDNTADLTIVSDNGVIDVNLKCDDLLNN